MKTFIVSGAMALLLTLHVGAVSAQAERSSAQPVKPQAGTFSAGEQRSGYAAVCGSSHSISAALDQCGKKGHLTALCKKGAGGVWSCSPSDKDSGPNIHKTGFKAKR